MGARLHAALSDVIPSDTAERIARAEPEYLQDARDLLFRLAPRTRIFEAVDAWLRSQSIAAYHATRLTEAEVESVRTEGLKLLRLEDRAPRFAEMLGDHNRWPEMEEALPSLLLEYGADSRRMFHGERQATVHACISKAGLFSMHYFDGAEVDQHIMSRLLPDGGLERLKRYAVPVLVCLEIPADEALKANNPSGRSQDVSSFIDEVMQPFAYWLGHPTYDVRVERNGVALWFERPLPPDWITAIKPVEEVSDVREPYRLVPSPVTAG